jgi:hypothetical protein
MNTRNSNLNIGPRDPSFHVVPPQTKEQLFVKDGQHRRLADAMTSKKNQKMIFNPRLLNENGESII